MSEKKDKLSDTECDMIASALEYQGASYLRSANSAPTDGIKREYLAMEKANRELAARIRKNPLLL